jgi:hypothetical protein
MGSACGPIPEKEARSKMRKKTKRQVPDLPSFGLQRQSVGRGAAG